MAIDLSDPALREAWQGLTKNDSTQNWLLFHFVEGSNKLAVSAVGEGGMNELKNRLQSDQIQVGAFRVVGVDNRETTVSRRPKFIWFTSIGSGVSVLKKARVSVQKPDLAKFFDSAQFNVEISSAEQLTNLEIGKKLLSSGGAHKPTHYEFAPGDTIAIADLS